MRATRAAVVGAFPFDDVGRIVPPNDVEVRAPGARMVLARAAGKQQNCQHGGTHASASRNGAYETMVGGAERRLSYLEQCS